MKKKIYENENEEKKMKYNEIMSNNNEKI